MLKNIKEKIFYHFFFLNLGVSVAVKGFPGGASGKEPACQTQKTLQTRVQSLGQEDPLEKGMAIHSLFLPGEVHGQRSMAGYSPCGQKESDMTEQLTHTHTLSKSLTLE